MEQEIGIDVIEQPFSLLRGKRVISIFLRKCLSPKSLLSLPARMPFVLVPGSLNLLFREIVPLLLGPLNVLANSASFGDAGGLNLL